MRYLRSTSVPGAIALLELCISFASVNEIHYPNVTLLLFVMYTFAEYFAHYLLKVLKPHHLALTNQQGFAFLPTKLSNDAFSFQPGGVELKDLLMYVQLPPLILLTVSKIYVRSGYPGLVSLSRSIVYSTLTFRLAMQLRGLAAA